MTLLILVHITPIALLLSGQQDWLLPYETWQPYNINNFFTFIVTYLLQLFGNFPFNFISTNVDALIVKLMMQYCILLKIFKYRIENFNQTNLNTFQRNRKIQNLKMLDIKYYVVRYQKLFRYSIFFIEINL